MLMMRPWRNPCAPLKENRICRKPCGFIRAFILRREKWQLVLVQISWSSCKSPMRWRARRALRSRLFSRPWPTPSKKRRKRAMVKKTIFVSTLIRRPVRPNCCASSPWWKWSKMMIWKCHSRLPGATIPMRKSVTRLLMNCRRSNLGVSPRKPPSK